MICNILAQKKQHGHEKLVRCPSSMKYLTTIISACFMALPLTAQAQTTAPGISDQGTVFKLLVPGEDSCPNTVTVKGQKSLPSFFYNPKAPALVGVWVKHGGSFTEDRDYTKVGSTTLFQIGGSAQYTGSNEEVFKNDANNLGGTISLSLLYTGISQRISTPPAPGDYPPPDNLSLTIAVIGSSKADSVFSAERLNSWAGVSELFIDKRKPDSMHIFVDGANSVKDTKINIDYSADVSAKNDTSFIVQNSGLIEIGNELTLTLRKEDDRFILENNSKSNSGLIVKGIPRTGGEFVDGGKDFNLFNSAAPVKNSDGTVDTSHTSDTALIKDSNVFIKNGSFTLQGGRYYYETHQEGDKKVDVLVDTFKPQTTFLQIINSKKSEAVFRANAIIVNSVVEGNTTTLLIGHGANIDAPHIALHAEKKGTSAVLMLGDTSSEDEYYGYKDGTDNHQKIESVTFGYDPDEGVRKIIFNNNHHGESAEKASFQISGHGTVHVQTGRTILTKNSPNFSGQTIIDPNTSLILTVEDKKAADTSCWGAGTSEITNNGELIYDGVTDDIHNRIVGRGNVVLNESYMYLEHNAEWTGITDIKGRSALSIGTLDNPVHIKSPDVNVSAGSSLWGFGVLEGNLNNNGYFRVGDNIPWLSSNRTIPRLIFTVEGNVNNSGSIYLGNGKIPDKSFNYQGNRLIVNGDYTDNGSLTFYTVLGNDDSPTDKLIVNGNINSGSSGIWVNNLRGLGAQTTNGIELIQVNGEKSDGNFKLTRRVTAGPYEYLLKRGSGANEKNWYLISQLKPVEPPPKNPADPNAHHDDQVQPLDVPLYRPEVSAYIGNSAVVQTLFSSRLHDRIGDLWYADPYAENNQLTGMWMKQRGNYNTWRESSGQTRNRTQMYATQLGADVASWTSNGENRFLVGWVAGYGHGRTKSRSIHTGYHAIGTVDGLNVGVTGTWYQDGLHHQGIYVDTWLTYGWFDNKVKGQGIETEKYHSRGFTGSLETGYTWKLGEHVTEKGCDIGWFLQPQAQMIWSGVKTDTFHEHNGTTVKSRGRNNIQTRLGARLMMDTNLRSYANGIGGTQFFIEGNWVHNTKSHGVEMNGTVFDQEGARHLGEVKFGINGKPTDNLHVWTNVTVRAGSHHYRDLTGMIGLKYSF